MDNWFGSARANERVRQTLRSRSHDRSQRANETVRVPLSNEPHGSHSGAQPRSRRLVGHPQARTIDSGQSWWAQRSTAIDLSHGSFVVGRSFLLADDALKINLRRREGAAD